jgi:hypothetical protein
MFSTALERGNDLAACIRAAAGRAKEGMLGAVDFGAVMAAGFAPRRGGGGGGEPQQGADALLADALGLVRPSHRLRRGGWGGVGWGGVAQPT